MGYIGRIPVLGSKVESQSIVATSVTNIFQLNFVPPSASAMMLFINGQAKKPFEDYTVDINGRLTLSASVAVGTQLLVVPLQVVTAATTAYGVSRKEEIVDIVSQNQNVVSLSSVPTSQIDVFVNGIQKSLGPDFSVSGNNLQFQTVLEQGDRVRAVWYT